MTSVARLRMDAARRNPRVKLGRTDLASPLLQTRAYEPWAPALGKTNKIRKKHHSYGEFVKSYPKLFDQGQLRITNADAALAHTMTFGLDPGEFAIGNVWPLAWHQLRRTGACNMLSTGIVSEGSLQYQLKHCSRAMSRYYGQNHYKLVGRLDEDAQGLYIREMYQAVVREFSSLQDDRYISPHGPKRKAQILVPISEKDHNSLAKDAEAGRISYRPTFLGGCAKPGPACPLGGISNLSGCMGHGEEVPCEWALLDRKKRAAIEDLCGTFKEQLKLAPPSSPLRESLQAQVESAERAIDVLDTL